MKFVLCGLLVVSLAANAVLFALHRQRSTVPVETDRFSESVIRPLTESAATALASAAPESVGKTMTWRADTSDEALRALADEMRLAGFPSRTIYAAISTAFHDANRPAPQPFWKRLSTERIKNDETLARTAAAKLEAILGPDAKLSARLDPVARARHYGNLSDDQINALDLVERDYQELKQNVAHSFRARNASTSQDSAIGGQQMKVIRAESARDIAALLSGADLLAYEMRHSGSGEMLGRVVKDVAITEEEFVALYHQRKLYDETTPRVSRDATAADRAKRETNQQLMEDNAKAVLGDGRFYTYLAEVNPAYRQIALLSADYASVTPAAAYQVTRLQNEAVEAGGNSQLSRQEKVKRYAEINARLDALIGAEAAGVVRTRDSVFKGPSISPAMKSTAPGK